jgi:hypothetical protein
MQQDVRELIIGQRGRFVGADRVGQGPGGVLRHRGVLRVEPAAVADVVAGDEHPLADLELTHLGTHRDHVPAHLIAEDEGQIGHPAVAPGADQQIEIIDPDRVGLDQHLAGAGLGARYIDEFEHLAAAGAADLDGFHGSPVFVKP